MALKNNIKFLRRSAEFDLTQQELAEALEVSRQTINAIENGRPPTGELMLKIASFFNKDVREIFFDDYVVSSLQKNSNLNLPNSIPQYPNELQR